MGQGGFDLEAEQMSGGHKKNLLRLIFALRGCGRNEENFLQKARPASRNAVSPGRWRAKMLRPPAAVPAAGLHPSFPAFLRIAIDGPSYRRCWAFGLHGRTCMAVSGADQGTPRRWGSQR